MLGPEHSLIIMCMHPKPLEINLILIMAIRVVEFSSGGYKIRKKFAKESTYPKKIVEFWINGELSKIGDHFSNKVI